MKLQTLALGLALAVAGSAFAATHETVVTHVAPNGTVTKRIVRTNDVPVVVHHRHYVHKVVVVNPHHHPVKKVVVLHPAHHRHYAVNRTVVVHHNG